MSPCSGSDIIISPLTTEQTTSLYLSDLYWLPIFHTLKNWTLSDSNHQPWCGRPAPYLCATYWPQPQHKSLHIQLKPYNRNHLCVWFHVQLNVQVLVGSVDVVTSVSTGQMMMSLPEQGGYTLIQPQDCRLQIAVWSHHLGT